MSIYATNIFTPPSTNDEWNNLIINEGLHVKWHNEAERPDKYASSQLQAMLDLHTSKKNIFETKKNDADQWVALIDSSSEAQALFMANAAGYDTSDEYREFLISDIEKFYRLDRIIQLISKEIQFREASTYSRTPVGTTYYIDADNGNDTNDGLGIGTAWATFSKFLASARSAGDVAIARRGMTANYGIGTISITSDGNRENPIVLEADFDDAWGDFSNSTQTFAPVLGSKTMEASATITGISAGDWIYNTTDGDDPRLFSYEVVSVSGTTLTLRLPFKGSAGSGKTLKVMPKEPIYGAAGGNDTINLSGDSHWRLQGIRFYGDHVGGQILMNSGVYGIEISDCILQGGNSSCDGITVQASVTAKIFKTYVYDYSTWGFDFVNNNNYVEATDCIFTGGTAATRGVFFAGSGGRFRGENLEMSGHSVADVEAAVSATPSVDCRLRNCKFDSSVGISVDTAGSSGGENDLVFSEDHNQVIGDNRVFSCAGSSNNDTPVTQSETTTVRAGGSSTSVKITPGTEIGAHQNGYLGLLGRTHLFLSDCIPIYADTTSRTYTFYFKTGATTDWTANPTASELFIEARYWGHASNVQRIPIRSTGTVSFTTTTDWQSIALTVQPAQTGLIYMRVVYGKTKESGKSNVFYFDPIPVIS